MSAPIAAPSAPMRGAPRLPKMNAQQKRTLSTFMVSAATRCT
jgi:hypothetical protein